MKHLEKHKKRMLKRNSRKIAIELSEKIEYGDMRGIRNIKFNIFNILI